MTVYLAGPINGCTDAEALDWRAEAAAHFAGRGARNVLAWLEGDHDGLTPDAWPKGWHTATTALRALLPSAPGGEGGA